MTRTYNFVSLIVNIILSQLLLVLSLPAAAKTQYFVHLIFNLTLQFKLCVSSDLQKLLIN